RRAPASAAPARAEAPRHSRAPRRRVARGAISWWRSLLSPGSQRVFVAQPKCQGACSMTSSVFGSAYAAPASEATMATSNSARVITCFISVASLPSLLTMAEVHRRDAEPQEGESRRVLAVGRRVLPSQIPGEPVVVAVGRPRRRGPLGASERLLRLHRGLQGSRDEDTRTLRRVVVALDKRERFVDLFSGAGEVSSI